MSSDCERHEVIRQLITHMSLEWPIREDRYDQLMDLMLGALVASDTQALQLVVTSVGRLHQNQLYWRLWSYVDFANRGIARIQANQSG